MTGIVGELTDLQRQANAEYAAMTPKERAAAAKRELARMPGQRYLFEAQRVRKSAES